MAITDKTDKGNDNETNDDGDNTLLIATDDGKIYRLVEERWRLPEFELGGDGDIAKFLKSRLLDNGVVTAHLLANPIEPAFTCYLLNLSMIKTAPEPTPEPTGSETPCGTDKKK